MIFTPYFITNLHFRKSLLIFPPFQDAYISNNIEKKPFLILNLHKLKTF